MTVVPRASTAAMRRFSVAPTLGKSRPTCGAAQAVGRLGHEEAVVDVDDGAQPLPARSTCMSSAARADGVAAGQGDVGRAAAGDQRPEDADRGPHRADEVVVGPVAEHGRDVDDDDAGRRVVVDRAAQAAQQLGHDLDVEDVRDVASACVVPVGEQRGRHQLEHAVLRAR